MKPLNTDEEDRIEELEESVAKLEKTEEALQEEIEETGARIAELENELSETEENRDEILDRNTKAQEELELLIRTATGMRDTLKFG